MESSNNDDQPQTDLRAPFENGYLVGIPVDIMSRLNVSSNEQANPWQEPPRSKSERKLRGFVPKISSNLNYENDYQEALLSLANPSSYTPKHPSELTNAPMFKRAVRTRVKAPADASASCSNQLPIIRLPEPKTVNNRQQSLGETILQPPRFRTCTPMGSMSLLATQTNQQDVTTNNNLPGITPPFQTRFAGAPSFTRFGTNGTPQMPHFNAQYLNSMTSTRPTVSSSNINENLPDAFNIGSPQYPPPPIINSSLPCDLRPRAQPVRNALVDYIRYISNSVPGVSFNSLMQQMQGSNPQNCLRLNVPQNADITALQQTIQRASLLYMGALNQQLRPPLVQPPHYSPYNIANQQIPNAAAPIPNASAPKPKVPTEDDMVQEDLEADADGDDEYNEIQTYADYRPAKINIGKAHPDPVVETSSLSSVEPPEVCYTLKLPSKVIEGALLSSLQLESVIYASQQHSEVMPDKKTRRGFLIGDGAGVGKGRTIAGIIYENYLNGRKKSIWLSVSTDLKFDAERDLKDIGAKIPVFLLSKFQYGRRINEDHGVIFTTYSGLVSKSQSIKGNYGSRLGQLVAWAGSNFDGIIVFDECHKAKNISLNNKPSTKISKAAEYVLEIQNKLPNARVVYASATGASETRHLGYMTRLGIWGAGTPYADFANFCEAIEKRGVGAMELVAVELKMRGSYIARQLSFKTTSFNIVRAKLTNEFIELYDQSVDMWAKALMYFREAETYIGDKKKSRTIWQSFWAAHQKFFKYLCISAKVPIVVEIAKESLEANKCVVIGLQSTGEAKTLEALEDGEINEFISTAKATFESLIDNHFPAPFQGRRRRRPSASTDSDIQPFLSSAPSDKSNSNFSNTTIDEAWINDDACKFIIQDGVALPKIETRSSAVLSLSSKNVPSRSPSKSSTLPMDKNQQALYELVEAKRQEIRSARTLRHKRRLAMRQKDKSRIKKITDEDSDSEETNPLSSCSEDVLSSRPSSSTLIDSDSDYEADTVTEYDGSDDDLIVIGTKSAKIVKKKRKNIIDDDSDDDVQITAVKNFVTIESGGEEEDESLSPNHKGADNDDPMLIYGERLTQMQSELYERIDALGPRLPHNTLDDLIDRLGGPSDVAEMTGRKGRVVKDLDGQISYRQRNEIDCSDAMNMEEKKRFMEGEKLIAIISEAASSGISLQADRRVENKRRRVHITIELPWSADRAIQQFGRTHRSNQLSGPEYVFVISDLSGETRFASIVAKRLESLGALTHGDRRATTDSRDLSQFNITSKYSRSALESLSRYLENNIEFADITKKYSKGAFIKNAREAYVGTGLGRYSYGDVFLTETIALNINIFLNRLLGMKVGIQNDIFDLFTSITDRLISRKKVAGEYDAGILELSSANGKTQVETPEMFILRASSGFVKCALRNVIYERGINWEEAVSTLANATEKDTRSGFYIASKLKTQIKLVILAVCESTDMFRIYKPNVGRQPKLEFYSNIREKYDLVSPVKAEGPWRQIFDLTGKQCVHRCYFGGCKRDEAKLKCDVGIRYRLYCILTGGILTIWPFLETKIPQATKKIQIVRLKLDDNTRVIGPVIPQDHVKTVREVLSEGQTKGIDYKPKGKA